MKFKRKAMALISLASMSLFGCRGGTFANPTQSNNGNTSDVDQSKKDSNQDLSISNADTSKSSDGGEQKDSASDSSIVEVTPVYKGMIIKNAISKQNYSSSLSTDISDYVSDFPNIKSENEVDYCIPLNQKIELFVRFSNLDKATITSLTINDKKYDVNKDMISADGVTIEVDEYITSGYKTLTLSNISYLSSLNKIGLLSCNYNLKLGVSYESIVTAKIDSKNITADSASFTLSFDNIESIPSNGKVLAYFSDGINDPIQREINIDSNKTATLTFNDLTFFTEYYFGVAASFDLYDGDGLHYSWILKENFKTLSTFSLESIETTQTSIGFSVNKENEDGESYVNSVTLLDGTTEIKKISKEEILTSNSFNDLLSNHSYVLSLNYIYKGKAYESRYDVKTNAMSTPVVLVKTSEITKKSFKYEIEKVDIDSICVIDSIKLVLGETETELPNTSGEVTNLLANGNYKIKIKYHYDLNEGTGEKSKEIVSDVTLLETLIPTLTLSVTQDEMTVSYNCVIENDEDAKITIDKVDLYDGTELKQTDEKTINGEGSFTGLYSDLEYTVKVYYHYDLGDGNGQIDKVETKTVKTKAMEKPVVEINANKLGKNFISGKIEINQEYNLVSNIKVTCQKNDEETKVPTGEIKESTGTSFEFSGLTSSTEYTITCTYDYTLNTKGESELHHEKVTSVRSTSLDFEVSDLKLDNTRPIEQGMNVYLSMKVHNGNVDNVQVVSILLNNEKINAASNVLVTGSGDGQVKFKMKTDSEDEIDKTNDYVGEDGLTTFTVNKIQVLHVPSGELYDVYLNDNNTVSAKVYGRVSVEKTYFADENNNKIDCFEKTDKVYVIVELNNKSEFEIKEINGLSSIESLDTKHSKYRFEYDPSNASYGFDKVGISNLTYNLNESVKTPEFDNVFAKGFVVKDKEAKLVSSWNDFYSMEDYYTYKLTTNLDFEDSMKDLVDYGKKFNGVFDGDGHSIQNLLFASDVENQDVNLGLFSSGEMILSNLKLENSYFGLELNNYKTNSVRNGYVGGFIGKSECSIINNCMVDDNSSILFENNTIDKAVINNTYVGGFVGYLGEYGEINNSVNESSLSTKNGYIGGFVGYLGGNINNCYNIGSVRYVKNSVTGSIGAFAGYFNRWSITSSINNSVNLGPDRFYSSTTRIVGTYNLYDSSRSDQINNVYNLSKLYDSSYDFKNSVTKLTRGEITSEFFTEKLKFNTDVWDVSKVDYKNKIYPTLKVFDK